MEKLTKSDKSVNPKQLRYFYGTGSRKTACARVRIYSGKGTVSINGKNVEKVDDICIAPLVLCGLKDKFDISVKVMGGGLHSQKEAIRHGVARALVEYQKDLKQVLRKAGFITRDPREKERKKPGLKRARRAPQFSKR